MAEKSLEEQNKELKKRLEDAEKQLSHMKGMQEDSEKRLSELNDEIEELEADAAFLTPAPSSNKKADYEQKTETSSRYDKYLIENKAFGWEKIKEFSYKKGGYRFTMRRDMNHPNYAIWKKNEELYTMLFVLTQVFYGITGEVDKLNVTFAEIASQPEYQLSGWRKIFGIRTKEQKAEINSKVQEINSAYARFKKETHEAEDFLYNTRNNFVQVVTEQPGKVHPAKPYILSLMEKYKIVRNNGCTSTDIKQIRYSFVTKSVELS